MARHKRKYEGRRKKALCKRIVDVVDRIMRHKAQSRTQDTGHRMRRVGHETWERDSELLCGSISEIVITEKVQQIHRRHDGAIQRGRCAMIRGHSRYDRDAQGVKPDAGRRMQDTGD